MKRKIGLICCVLAVLACLNGCGKDEKVGSPSQSSGIGRDTVLDAIPIISDPDEIAGGEETTEAETEVTIEDTPVVTGEPSYTIKDGKYVYSIPAPNRSSLSDLSDIRAMSNAFFSDNGEDASGSWYPGKVERNLATGEVTYVWDRAKDTLAILEKYNGVYRQNEDEKVIYLTFDCGYENGWTEPVLDVLKEKNAPGLFFLTGHYVETAEAQIRRMLDEGHLIGNHTVNHVNATQVTPEKFVEEIEGLEKMIAERFPDAPPMIYYRPSYGACNEKSLALANKMGLHSILWSWAYYDYDEANQMDPAVALQKAKQGLHNGAVYLFHTVGSTNAAILGDFIDYAREQGYEIRPIMG